MINSELSDEAAELGRLALRVLRDVGGDDLARAATHDQEPVSAVASALDRIGVWQLDPRRSLAELEAAAAVCQSAGYWAVPYPVAQRLSCPAGLAADALAVVAAAHQATAIGGSGLRWATVDPHGRRSLVSASPSPGESPALRHVDDGGAGDLPLALVLPCWTLLGLLDRAIELTRSHVLSREQFDQPIAAFQAVKFQLTEAEVERVGALELAKYALWSARELPADALADALALRLAAIEAADVVFRVAHQLHGAMGFCDESVLSWLSRASEPLRRRPFGRSATLDQLARQAGRRGLTGIFSGGAAPAWPGGKASPVAALPAQRQPAAGPVRSADPAT